MVAVETAQSQDAKMVAAILKHADLLLVPGAVVELRVLGGTPQSGGAAGRGAVASGYFDYPPALASAAAAYNRRGGNVYITLNQLRPDVMARAPNRMMERPAATTSDAEVERRCWFPIDLDPVRSSGISSSGPEHQAAFEAAALARTWLTEQGWPLPILADSGNGMHLLYAIDLPNNESSTTLIKQALAALSARFSTPQVKLDTSVYNAARIWKLYGTYARKGAHLPERPHRQAKVLSAPSPCSLVSRAQLEQLAALAAPAGAPVLRAAAVVPPSREGYTLAYLQEWLLVHGAVVRKVKQEETRAVLELERCPFNPDHHEPGKACVTLTHEGIPGFKCHAEGCAEYHWQDLKLLWFQYPLRVVSEENTSQPRSHQQDTISGEAGQRPWPVLGEAAYPGLVGEIVQAVSPYTEADPVAILVHLLVGVGCAIGPGPHMLVGATRHDPRLFSVIVGQSANSRKGDAWAVARALLAGIPTPPPILSALSSGEGLIRLVADEIREMRAVKVPKGQPPAFEEVVVQQGVDDKRLLIVTSEMGGLFQVMRRESNIITATLRDAWDRGDLVVPTRNNPLRATGAYLAFVGHITEEELKSELTSLHAANGFANRFCFFLVRRSKSLPRPKALTPDVLAELSATLQERIATARAIGRMDFDEAAAAYWDARYEDFSRERAGFAGALLSRAPAQVLRLAMLYALLDGSPLIRGAHLDAAATLWEYAEASVGFLFTSQRRSRQEDKIIAALTERGPLTRTQLFRDVFGCNLPSADLSALLDSLAEQGKVRCTRQEGSMGRPMELVMLVAPGAV